MPRCYRSQNLAISLTQIPDQPLQSDRQPSCFTIKHQHIVIVCPSLGTPQMETVAVRACSFCLHKLKCFVVACVVWCHNIRNWKAMASSCKPRVPGWATSTLTTELHSATTSSLQSSISGAYELQSHSYAPVNTVQMVLNTPVTQLLAATKHVKHNHGYLWVIIHAEISREECSISVEFYHGKDWSIFTYKNRSIDRFHTSFLIPIHWSIPSWIF